jgi:UDP-2,3-diacylglucosamine pyrophosphatase LpxH
MLYLIVSDFHLGKGKFTQNGQLNILEDFFEDERFGEFCDFFSTTKYHLSPVHLVLAGDIFNLIQIDVEGVFSHIVDEDWALKAFEQIVKGHPIFFQTLRRFLQQPEKKITFVIGNHDAAMGFEALQRRMCDLVGEGLEFTHELIENGVHVEHGHRFEVINSVPPHRYFITGPGGKKILNLPWGSLFCIEVLPRLKKMRPHIDKVRPMNAYLRWTLINDFTFFIRMMITVIGYLIRTSFDAYTKQNRNFKTTVGMLKQITIYPQYSRKARSILKKNKQIHTVVMGHTHLQEWRRYPEGRYYFNTGTWNMIPSMDAGLHDDQLKLSYVALDVHTKTGQLKTGSLNIWQGNWRPYREEVTTA